MIPNPEFNIWEHSRSLKELYATRAGNLAPEMDALAQGAEILRPWAKNGETLLDAGCGSGYFKHSLVKKGLDLVYQGLDYTPGLVDIGRKYLGPEAIKLGAIEDLTPQKSLALFGRESFNYITLINTLTFSPDFRVILDRLANLKPKIFIIRDNFGPETITRWETDGFLDDGYNHLKAYWNQWSRTEVAAFLNDLGFKTKFITDNRTRGQVEMVVGKPYYWEWLIAESYPLTKFGPGV